jgi:catechol 2,3-dioxygenase-like lactoylglutathione lyase family enzyme
VTVLDPAELVAFVPASDLGRARHFYETVLGLSCVDATAVAAVFDCGRATLRVTSVPAFSPAGHTVIGWAVPDLGAAVQSLIEQAVVMERYPGIEQDERGIWTTSDGDQVVWFKDSEGNTLSLTQPARR